MCNHIKRYIFFPNIHPIIFSIGPISLRWYGLMYLFGFLLIKFLIIRKIDCFPYKWNVKKIKKFLYICFMNVVIFSRIGYVIFYNIHYLFKDPIYLFMIWRGGMSFHGGLIGAIISIMFFTKNSKKNFFAVCDFIVQFVPIGLGIGRIGNFINGELWGRVSIHTPWAMLFQNSKNIDYNLLQFCPEFKKIFFYYGMLPRHPSQIYEAFFEGFILFFILKIFSNKKMPIANMSAIFLFFYGSFRIFIEFFREPDQQIGMLFGMTMGQILSIPMVLFGLKILLLPYKNI